MEHLDEAQLVTRARRGSRRAGRELVLRHWPTVWKAVLALTGRPALAEEIAQETFARAFSALDTFDAERPLGPWLRRIAINRAIDELRRERRLELVDPATIDAAYEQTLPDHATLDAVRELDPDRRAVVVLRFWLDWPLDRIATELGIPIGTVSSRLTRALEELRRREEGRACSA